MKKKIALLSFLLSGGWALTAQAQDATGEFIRSGLINAEKLTRAYGSPLIKGFGTDLNNGWITSGKVFKPGRFELRVFASGAFAQGENKEFDVTAIGLDNSVRFGTPSQTIAPTVLGENTDGPRLDVYAPDPRTGRTTEVRVASFNTPPGIGINVVPLPMAQFSIGLIKKTELMVRYMPEYTYKDDYKASLRGIGLKHSISQWIPIVSALPFDITAAVGYTELKSSARLEVKPQTTVENRPVVQSSADFSNQLLHFNTKGYTGSLVVSKTILAFSGFLGFNYSKSETELKLTGIYPITDVRTKGANDYEYYVRDLTDPISIPVNYEQVGVTGGLRFKMPLFSLYAQGTYAKFPSVTAGLGIGWN